MLINNVEFPDLQVLECVKTFAEEGSSQLIKKLMRDFSCDRTEAYKILSLMRKNKKVTEVVYSGQSCINVKKYD